ncbi:hypothetical protein EV426DRAFT_706628 [Tirmania nivea]|nr:hypothetical protein EV426DRAFT_706628 [Tirmania nivea]
MSPTPSIPEVEENYTTPSTPQDDSDDSQSYPPLHPVPSMQAAFEESMYEQGHPPPEAINPYAISSTLPNSISISAAFKPKYHPLTKLVSQITFGIHLLHKRLAKSDSEVVRILQAHVNDMDNFLSTTTRDFDAARSDISTRIKNLKVPLEAGPASDVFENMLKEPGFRVQIMEGNKKVDFVIKRTAKAMNRALEDVGEGLRAVDELAKYLLTLKTGWRNANLMRVYGAMTHNVEGWFRCFVGLQMKGQVLGERLNALKMVVWEIERRCGRASRGNGRNSTAVIQKRPSLNQIPENPSGEAADAAVASKFKTSTQTAVPLKEVAEKSLPATPVPSPLPVVGRRKDAKHKRHSSGEIVGSPPVTPRRTLSKRRTSMPGPPTGVMLGSSSPKAQKAKERAVDTIVVLDPESGSLRRKRIHRRSATVHAHPGKVPSAAELEGVQRPLTAGRHAPQVTGTCTITTTVSACISDSQAGTGNGGGVLSSLRRSLSLGRSTSGRPRSRSRDRKVIEGKGEVRGRTPPVPQLPLEVKYKLERARQHAVDPAEITPPASRDSKAAVSEKSHISGHGGVAGAVMAGIASIKKRKSKTHLHHPSGQFYVAGSGHPNDQRLVPTTSNTHINDQAIATDQQRISMPAPGHLKRTQTVPVPAKNMPVGSRKGGNKSRHPEALKINTTATRPAAQAPVELPSPAPVNPQTPTTPRAKSRRNSSAISNLLSLRPKSRTGISAPVPTEPVPPLPVSMLAKPVPQQQQAQTLAIKDSNVGHSAILAGIRDLQNGKKAQAATPGFRLQGISGAATQAEIRSTRRVSHVGSSHTANTKGDSESGKRAYEVSGGSPPQAQRKNSFLVKFFTDRAF